MGETFIGSSRRSDPCIGSFSVRYSVWISGRDEPLDKRNECACLGAGEATRRVNRGQIGRRQGPVIQDRHDLSGSQLGREVPLRRYSQCHVAVHRLPHALGCVIFLSSLENHRHLRSRLSKGPGVPSIGAPRINDGLMADQLARGCGSSMAL